MKIARKQLFLDFDPTAEWQLVPELFVIFQLLEPHAPIIRRVAACFSNAVEDGTPVMGCDGMTVEQILRAAIYKQIKRLSYRELSLHTADSIMGRKFMKMEYGQHFSHQALQDNISMITPEAWAEVLSMINLVGLDLGADDGQKLRSDATTIETNVHYPNEAQMLWDCVRVACRLLARISKEHVGFGFRDYRIGAKKTWFHIVNTKPDAQKKKGFKKLLKTVQACLNQVDATLDKAQRLNLSISKPLYELAMMRPRIQKAYDMTRRHQLEGEDVPVADKILSLFEDHTDCIVKGQRKSVFGHKINLTTGKSSLIFDCHIERGNWSEKNILGTVLENATTTYPIKPRDVVADGGQASLDSLKKAVELEITNIVFGKTVGKLQNQTTSKNMETRLKKWRSGSEADISNFKRGLDAGRCNWKGWDAFQSFVLLNAVVFNLKVIAAHVLNQL